MMLAHLYLLGTAMLAAVPSPNAPSSPASTVVSVSQCLVTLIDDVEVPARQAGVLQSLQLEDGTRVTEGLSVRKNQKLGKLDDAEALARRKATEFEHKVAMAEQLKSAAAIQVADATVEVAKAEVGESQDINRISPGSIAPTQVRRQVLTEDRAKNEALVARRDSDSAGLTVQLREAQIEVAGLTLDHHQIESPLDGEVVQLYKNVGEWVNPGDPILRIVYLEKLRVEGFLLADQLLPEEVVGRSVQIDVRLKERTETFNSVITFVSPIVEASGEYRVWAEVANRRVNSYPVLRPGMSADMRISLEGATAVGSR